MLYEHPRCKDVLDRHVGLKSAGSSLNNAPPNQGSKGGGTKAVIPQHPHQPVSSQVLLPTRILYQ